MIKPEGCLAMVSSHEESSSLLKEIRECDLCRKYSKHTPFVYGSCGADLLVVSEMPPRKAWDDNIGEKWRKDLFACREKGAPHTLCEWLGMKKEEARERFFWIQRANCYVNEGKEYAFQHCSSKYIPRAISLVRPKVIIILGRSAAQYFTQFEKLEDAMEKTIKEGVEYKVGDKEYPCFVLYHPSPANPKRKTEIQKEVLNKLKAHLVVRPSNET